MGAFLDIVQAELATPLCGVTAPSLLACRRVARHQEIQIGGTTASEVSWFGVRTQRRLESSKKSPNHNTTSRKKIVAPRCRGTWREIREDCLVTINFDSHTISAKPGEVFPSTGIMVVSANRRTGYVWLRSRFTKTVMMDERLKMLEESLKAMRQLRGNRVAGGDDEGMERLDKAIAEQQVAIGAERHMRNLRWELESLHDARNSALGGGDRKKRLTQQIDVLTSEIEALER